MTVMRIEIRCLQFSHFSSTSIKFLMLLKRIIGDLPVTPFPLLPLPIFPSLLLCSCLNYGSAKIQLMQMTTVEGKVEFPFGESASQVKLSERKVLGKGRGEGGEKGVEIRKSHIQVDK